MDVINYLGFHRKNRSDLGGINNLDNFTYFLVKKEKQKLTNITQVIKKNTSHQTSS